MNQLEQFIEDLISKGETKVVWEPINDVYENPKNPTKIKATDFERLKKSISQFPEMMQYRACIADANKMLIAGNKRHRACKALGWHKVPVIYATDLTEEQLKELLIKDNLHDFGKWDNKIIKDDWDLNVLTNWGFDTSKLIGAQHLPGEIIFSPELDDQSNYVLLKFSKDTDWLHIQTILGLEAVYGKRGNGKPWAKGTGRVVDGLKAIKNIKDSNINL